MTDPVEHDRLDHALIELDMRIHSGLTFDEVMQPTLEGFVTALAADAGDIKLLADDVWEVCYQVGFDAGDIGLQLSLRDAPVAEKVRQLGGPVVVEDYFAEPPESYVGFPLLHGLRAGLAVPLVIRGSIVGCLFAWMQRAPRAFTDDEVEFGKRVAASVALALANARLFAAEQDARRRAEAAERGLAEELQRTRVLLRASDELLSTSDPDEVLDRLASVVLDATGLSRVFINLIDQRERVLIPKIPAGGIAAPAGTVIPFEELSETSRVAIANGLPVVLDYELPDIPERDRAIARANDARVVLFVPLAHRGTVIGHITLDEPGERHVFSEEEVRVVASIAAEASVALHNARTAAEHAVEVLEWQLRRIAYGLHDGPAQTLSAAGAMLERAGRSENLETMRAQVAASGGLLDHVLYEMRQIMRELRPAELEEESLVAKLSHYIATFRQRWNLPVQLEVVGDEVRVSRHLQVSFFRVVQEALSNARKHANAKSVLVEVRFLPGVVECVVRDDGEGFDPGHVEGPDATAHWGLTSMGERMLMVGGELEVESVAGQGTEVRARAPLDTVGEAGS